MAHKNIAARRQYEREWREKNLDRSRENKRSWRAANRERVREWSWKQKSILYNGSPLTWSVFIASLEAQGGCCATCPKRLDPFARETHADHDHSTGEFRGVLCNDCNSVIAFSRENISRLEGVIAYLKARYGS
jgi:hypothetical protein